MLNILAGHDSHRSPELWYIFIVCSFLSVQAMSPLGVTTMLCGRILPHPMTRTDRPAESNTCSLCSHSAMTMFPFGRNATLLGDVILPGIPPTCSMLNKRRAPADDITAAPSVVVDEGDDGRDECSAWSVAELQPDVTSASDTLMAPSVGSFFMLLGPAAVTQISCLVVVDVLGLFTAFTRPILTSFRVGPTAFRIIHLRRLFEPTPTSKWLFPTKRSPVVVGLCEPFSSSRPSSSSSMLISCRVPIMRSNSSEDGTNFIAFFVLYRPSEGIAVSDMDENLLMR